MLVTFLVHTIERRQWISSLWSVDEMVFGKIGLAHGGTTTRHAMSSHYKQLYASYPTALTQASSILKHHYQDFIVNHPKDFEDLYDRLQLLIGNISGIGCLAIYDIALSVGSNLYPRVFPQQYVYIHKNKVKNAALKLTSSIKKNWTRVHISFFEPFFPYYSAMEIEDILCIFNKEIVNGTFSIHMLNQKNIHSMY